MEKSSKTVNDKLDRTTSNASVSSDSTSANEPSKLPFAWRRRFFESNDSKKNQDNRPKDQSRTSEKDTLNSPRQDDAKIEPIVVDDRDWYNFHLPTGIVLVPYAFSSVSKSSNASTQDLQQSKKSRNNKKKGILNSVSISNYRRIEELRRGDRIVLPDDVEIKNLNKGILPKGVLIVSRLGIQEGTNLLALQVRTFVQLLLYEFVLPQHVRVLHLVETETALMDKVSPNLPLPGFFTLEHAYLLEMELDYNPTEEELQANTAAPLYRVQCAFLSASGGITKQKFIAAETVHSAVNRLHVSWHVGQKSRDTDFVNSNKWVLWLLKYTPSGMSNSSKRREESWIEAETYQVLGWSTSGVMATGTESLGAVQIAELMAPFKHFEEETFKALTADM